MVAQTSSAGGDRAPQQVRITLTATIDVTIEPLPPATGEAQSNPPAPAPKPEPEPASEELSDSLLTWFPLAAPDTGVVSGDRRFVIVAHVAGPVHYIATDTWTGERATVFDRLRAAVDWCRGRLATVPLVWEEDNSGWKARRGGPALRVTTCGGQFQGRDCRFGTENKNRYSPLFDHRSDAHRWCEVRAMCVVHDGGGTAAPFYVTPPNPQS